ncbi:scavenger receptor cysteine-rich domain superfamily protein-like [Pomacea canaliculata]|uniref:scavenger receptor cysteine-rich domain superfamily protein-like n=1 Tax=Pomacea canaliculata TaxID=400727 RepID=UPI000D72EB92|nr:scavenger receptor cysteine-rich domain superfamily protein-like [Pomacea canaliculata]XP_025102879.1 scavenger receptor cysteine-rich domain superfamily protein-like [Pomacea canaliculata]
MLVVTFVYFAFLLLIQYVDSQLQVRLRHGPVPSDGVLQILYQGTWGSVCVNRFSKQETKVTCRMLGFNTSQALTFLVPTYQAVLDYILIENLRCTGEETSLNQCSHTGVNTSARCLYAVYSSCNSGYKRLRLRDSQDIGPNRGQVEIDIGDGQWMTLCVSSNITAAVVCRQLGLSSERNSAMLISREIRSRRRKTIFSACLGNETSIFECQHEMSYSKYCLYKLLCTPLTIKSEGSRHPLMEETNATLKCENNERSDVINYTWPENAGGFPDGSSLIITRVTRKHHGRRVRCEAMYSDGGVVSSDTLQLQVYCEYCDPAKIKTMNKAN